MQHHSLHSRAESHAGRRVLHPHDVSVVVAVNLDRQTSLQKEPFHNSLAFFFSSSDKYLEHSVEMWSEGVFNCVFVSWSEEMTLYVNSSSR